MKNDNNSDRIFLDVNSTLTQIQNLKRDRSYRDTNRLFYIEGVRNFIQAIDNNFAIATIIYSEKLLTAPVARKLVRQSRRSGIHTISITPEQFRSISSTEKASGIGAIVHQNWLRLQDVSPNADRSWFVLETVRNAGNLGTLIRTSEALGGASLSHKS
jgi:RNA methyltransferase, TrmH family